MNCSIVYRLIWETAGSAGGPFVVLLLCWFEFLGSTCIVWDDMVSVPCTVMFRGCICCSLAGMYLRGGGTDTS